MKKITHAFVFDVESMGLHGSSFAVAGGIYFRDGSAEKEFTFAIDRKFTLGSADDRAWVDGNVPEIAVSHGWRSDMMDAFWEQWASAKEKYPEIVMAAECGWPVEARFLAECVDGDADGRKWQGPYPLHEIATFMLAAGMDPMAEYPREDNEVPKHDPLADTRQSARLLFEALGKLNLL